MPQARQHGEEILGFSIRCPHCFNASLWRDLDPAQYIVDTTQEWKEILNGLMADPENFVHEKMLCCLHYPDHGCPLPFQAFLCKDSKTAHQRRHDAPSWSQAYAFRLRHINQKDLLSYNVVMLSARSVRRQKHIDLDSLIDRDLLSRSVLGMSYEINAPITIYTPKFIDKDGMVDEVWLPIEAYDCECNPVPPHYNHFCEICREAFLAPILDHCEQNKHASGACSSSYGQARGNEKYCLGKLAPCDLGSPNWNQCPNFLKKRANDCQCYASDYKLIQNMKIQWSEGKLDRTNATLSECWAGLQELSVPIIIHEHLAGIAMTGQLITREKALNIDIEQLIKQNPILKPHQRRLQRIVALLRGKAEPRNSLERLSTRFVLDDNKLEEVKDRFAANIKRLADTANAKYHQGRSRSEAAFREQMLIRITLSENDRKERLDLFKLVLARMREFWAFRSVYWFTWNDDTKNVTLVAKAHRDGNPEFVNKQVGNINLPFNKIIFHPWLYRRFAQRVTPATGTPFPHPNPWIESFRRTYEYIPHELVPELDYPAPTSHFFVFVNNGRSIHALVFAGRDEDQVSPLRPADKGYVSLTCQRTISDTCGSIMREYFAMENLDLLQWQREALTVGAIGTTMVHDLRHGLVETRDQCDDAIQAIDDADLPNVKSAIGAIRDSIKNNIELLGHVENFRREKKPDFHLTNMRNLLDSCIAEARLLSNRIKPSLIGGENVRIQIDPLLVSVAINNILTNVRNHALGISELIISADFTAENNVLVTIEDDGEGFSQELLSEFDAHINGGILTSPDHQLGLGIVIVKAVMDLHGGRLLLRNRDKCHGGRVELLFPNQIN